MDLAKISADELEDKYLREGLLHEVAKSYARNVDFKPTQEIINTDSALMWQAAELLARNMLRCGHVTDLEIIASKDQGRSQSLTLQWLAEWYAKHSNQTQSSATLSKIKDADIRHDAEFNIAAEELVKQKFNHSDSTMRKVLAVSSIRNGSSMDDLVAQNLAIVYAADGHIFQAIAHLSHMKGPEKMYAFYAVAGALDHKSQPGELKSFSKAALEAASSSNNDQNQEYALSLVATALARLGLFEDAMTLASGIPNEQRKTEALVMTAVYLIEAKRNDEAAKVLSRLSVKKQSNGAEESTRVNGWYWIAIAQANAGDGEAALRTLGLLDMPSMTNFVTLQKAYAYAKMARFAQASTLALSIPQENPEDERGRAFRLLAAAMTNKDGPLKARTWAKLLGSPQDRVSAYLGIADGLFGNAHEEVPLYFED